MINKQFVVFLCSPPAAAAAAVAVTQTKAAGPGQDLLCFVQKEINAETLNTEEN